ncbi:MAG: hypothetical protein WAK17_05470 [Candidatus Nitrosopolaris sp.]|jgi:hypothetical protein
MRFKKLLDKLGIEVVKSDRPLSQFFAWDGILKSSKSYECYLCGTKFADINALNRHYKDFCGPKEGSV